MPAEHIKPDNAGQPSGPPTDRRSSPRIPCNEEAWCHRRSTAMAVRLKDLSAGGACFIAAQPVLAGVQVSLQREHMSSWGAMKAVVVRSILRDDGLYEVSIRFSMDPRQDFYRRFPSRAPMVMTIS